MKIAAILLLFFFPLTLHSEDIPRRIIAFWNSTTDKVVEDSLIHRTLEMPLNYLGLDVDYWDIQKPLPDLFSNDDIRGILICFKNGISMVNPEEFIDWVCKAIDIGKKVVLMRNHGFSANTKGDFTSGDAQNRLFERLGFTNSLDWVDYPYDYQVTEMDQEFFNFEKPLPSILPPFNLTHLLASTGKSLLRVGIPGKPESEADLAIISPHGGYIAENYAYFFDPIEFTTNSRSLGWYVNPFRFFALAFDTASLPVPDTTTLAGRRIFFSACHGDNWNAETTIEEYHGHEVYCSEVLLDKVIKPNPDLPIAVGFVAADFDPKWAMKEKSQEIMIKYMNLPHVEAVSHTYSHPFYWDFFRTGGPEKEIDYLSFYPYGSWQNSFLSWFKARIYQISNPKKFAEKLKWGYGKPRAYANEKFNLEKEITGALNFLNAFAPLENQIKLLIWSGDSRPWDVPVQLTEKAGMKNFGGGYVQFDSLHPSVLFVYPLCRKPGGIIQLYCPSNPENAYTNGWTDQFYGFQYLKETLINTEMPRRLKPIALYYHSYSGQFSASVNAILSNIKFIRTQSPISLQLGRYIDIGNGFFSVRIERIGDKIWKIKNRQGLQTIRFDEAQDQQVDFSKSKGIIGYRIYQGSLYIYLDASVEEPIIAVKPFDHEDLLYLIESSWEVWDLKREAKGLSFKAKGWGQLFMRWNTKQNGTYRIISPYLTEEHYNNAYHNILELTLELPYNKEVEVRIEAQ